MIIWDPSMSTGIEHLDSQHKTLFEKFNELEKAFAKENSAEIILAVGEFLDFLQFYATWHFEQEEECMSQYNCPFAAVNKNFHTIFLKRFKDFYEQWQQGNMDLEAAHEAYASGALWLKNHVIGIDTKLRDSLQPQ